MKKIAFQIKISRDELNGRLDMAKKRISDQEVTFEKITHNETPRTKQITNTTTKNKLKGAEG